MIDLKTLKELVRLMATNELTELDLQDAQGERVTLKRGHGGGGMQPAYAAPAHAAPQPAAAPPSPAAAAPAAPAPTGAAADDGLVPIASPMVGTFYAASTPDAKPFANVGDRITPDTVVCIIEAMKVFNEIKAETAGVIQKVLVTNGKAVEFGQPLFMVKPG